MILYQQGDDGKLHPVAFDGRKLHGAELGYLTHEKELLVIKDALQKWHHYIENGLQIMVITDHESLKYMNIVQKSSKQLTRGVDEFQQYDLIIKYHPEKQTIVSDAISGRPDFNALMLRNVEDYVSYIRQFLQDQSFPADASELNKTQIIAEVDKFVLDDEVFYSIDLDGAQTPGLGPFLGLIYVRMRWGRSQGSAAVIIYFIWGRSQRSQPIRDSPLPRPRR